MVLQISVAISYLVFSIFVYLNRLPVMLTVQRLQVTFARSDKLPRTRIESIEYILQLYR